MARDGSAKGHTGSKAEHAIHIVDHLIKEKEKEEKKKNAGESKI